MLLSVDNIARPINWNLIISIAALVLSLSSWVYILITNRKKVNLVVDRYIDTYVHPKCIYTFFVIIENCSRLPISISKISICSGKSEFPFETLSKRVLAQRETQGSKVIRENEIYSCKFPLNLPSLSSSREFLRLEIQGGNPLSFSKPVTFVFYTNRGIQKKILSRLDKARSQNHNEFFPLFSR